jgi:peptidoglycan/LPS O-acetylase OafA/YrhL
MSAQPRLHSLDNLRATMMWLGVVLHVASVHQVYQSASFWRDPQTSLVADVLVALIHYFRMPVFFVVSGFFAALLVERRGPGGMLAHRAMRVGLPLLVFLPILLVVTVVLATMYALPSGSAPTLGFDVHVLPLKRGGLRLQTLHLWFLHLLMGFALLTALSCALVARVPDALRQRAMALSSRGAASAAAFLVLAMPLAVVGRHHPPFGVLPTSADLLPPVAEWVHYGLYFAFGFVLYLCRNRLLPLYERRVWRNALAGVGCIGIMAVISQTELRLPGVVPNVVFWMSFFYNACAWLWSLALIGGFVRYMRAQNRLLRYMAESSYWVYLVHLPLIGVVALVLREWHLPAELKMLLNIGLTTALSVASYHWLVRHRPIGVFLNGPSKKTEAAPAHTTVSPRSDV